MRGLHEAQRRFRDALLNHDARLVDRQIRSDGLPIDRRLGIYRNNVFTNLREALRALFPVTDKLVGQEFFDYAANEYIHRYPSPAGDLNQFGEYLAEFFSAFEPAAGLPYLPDVARLEWLAHMVYQAGEHNSMAIQQLATVTPERYGDLHFILNPACALLVSAYPVHRIWHVNQSGYVGDPIVDLNAGGVRLLLQRHAALIELQTLSVGEWELLSLLAQDKDFATACAQALHAEPTLNLGDTLARLVTQATLVDFRVRDPRE
jgi:hypothetical protein